MTQSIQASKTAQAWIAIVDTAARMIPESQSDVAMRRGIILGAIAALQRIGVDGETLVRYGMTPRVLFPLLVGLGDGAPAAAVNGADWRRLLDLPKPDADDFNVLFDAAWHRLILDLEAWTFNAPLIDILEFTAPTPDQMVGFRVADRPRPEVVDPYRWVWQRSVQPDVDRWTDASLHLEFRWRHRVGSQLFAPDVLDHPGPSLGALHEQIAGRTVLGGSGDDSPAETLFWQLQETAVEFLSRGKYDQAWGLFDFYQRQHQSDPRVINNLGFCKMPTDPEDALDLLEQALLGGYEFRSINVLNQCCCLVALDRLGDALTRAEAYWQRERMDPSPDAAYVWRFEDGAWSLDPNRRPEVAMVELSIRAARALGRPDRVLKWEQRLAGLAN